ncbi:MAG: P-II family nitrogen regulator [Oscillospiraceae bacterium]
MKMIKAIVRPEKLHSLMYELDQKGFSALTRISVLGRGKQRGLKVGGAYYDELPKDMLMMVVEDKDSDAVLEIIVKVCKSPSGGAYGDGKIFVSTIERAITISSGEERL